MPDGNDSDQLVLDESQLANSQANQGNAAGRSTRASSAGATLRPRRRSTVVDGPDIPPAPEDPRPTRSTWKRNATLLEQEERTVDSPETSPSHTRASSDDSPVLVCICQPEQKPPRPRNAFILYRQHHQATVALRNPGLANPDISKIIGEQWQNESDEQKNRWKLLAEEEKKLHQHKYPNYRYQPKRNGRNSADAAAGERARCAKCGGRNILTPTPASLPSLSTALPNISGPAGTPVTRTVPSLRELSLEPPATRRQSGRVQPPNNMSVHHRDQSDERDDLGPMSPETKRRRYNDLPPLSNHRTMPPRYPTLPGGQVLSPSTPFPFGYHAPPPPPGYVPVAGPSRRESLPPIKGIISPSAPMPPPPRPIMGYQQHRLSQGHATQDRSLTLPPLQIIRSASVTAAAPDTPRTVDEQMDGLNFRHKIKTLSQVSRPAPKYRDHARGPLIAVEGDSSAAAQALATWLSDMLAKQDDLAVTTLAGPDVGPRYATQVEVMAQYHGIAADWLHRNEGTVRSLSSVPRPEGTNDRHTDDTGAKESAATSNREMNGSSRDASSKTSETDRPAGPEALHPEQSTRPTSILSLTNDTMDIDTKPKPTSPIPSSPPARKPLTLIPNYHLHACNTFARRIGIGPHESYTGRDHWQWMAIVWRGVVGPDLTVYVRDSASLEPLSGPVVGMEVVEGAADVAVFIVRRAVGEGSGSSNSEGEEGLDPTVLRRVGFEVSEWIRAFRGTALE